MDCVKIRNIEAICLVCVGVINHIILSLPNAILSSTGSAASLNITFIVLIGLLLGYFVSKVFQKFPGCDILDITQSLGGNGLKKLLGIAYIVFFIFSSSLIIRTFAENLKIQYFATTPLYIIILAFLIITGFANFLGSKAIIRCNSIVTPIMIISLLIAFLSVAPEFVWQRFFPILGYGWSDTFLNGCSNLFTLSGLCILFFLPPFLEKESHIQKVSLLSIVIAGILLILSVTSLLLSLPFITSTDELSPMFLLIRNAEWGQVFQRPESLFVLIWCLSILSYLSVVTMLAHHVFKKISGVEKQKLSVSILLLLVFLFAMLPDNFAEIYFAHYAIYRYVSIGFVIILQPLICLLAYLKQKRKSVTSARKE